MVTIYDIAKRCGVSPATVSKALSNATDVSATTREKIRAAAVEMHYVPDSHAKSLSRNRSWSIGILCQDGSEMGLSHYLFAAIIESFKRNMEQQGYDIFFVSNQVGNMDFTYLQHCHYRKADGVFVVNSNPGYPDSAELIKSSIPKIAFDYSDENIGAVTTDSVLGMRMLYDHLYELGHRDIVYLHGDLQREVTKERIEALKSAAQEKGESFGRENLVQSTYYSIRDGHAAMKGLLESGRKPTAVICSDDYTAMGVIGAIREAGMSVPEDISVCGYDGIEITQLVYPQLTTIKQDTKAIGESAAKYLVERMNGGKNLPNEIIKIQPQLIIGESCRKIN